APPARPQAHTRGVASGDPTCAGTKGWTLRVLVTGAGGFVGGHLRSALERRGHEVVPVFSPRHATSERLAVDLADADAAARAVADARPDAVIHLAARARPAGLESFQALRSEEHTSELQSRGHLVCRLLLE